MLSLFAKLVSPKTTSQRSEAFIACTFVLFFSLTVSLPAWSQMDEPTHRSTLVIGKVSNNPKKHYAYFKPIADYVVSKMSDLGIREAEVLFAKNDEEMIRYLTAGRIDWVSESVFSALKYQEEADAELLLRKWKKGVPDYHTVFIVRKDSGITKLSDLIGKKLALEDAGSTTAFFLPMVELLQHQLTPAAMLSPRENVKSTAVGYAFARQEINLATWVHKGVTHAGAYSNLDWDKDDHTPEAFKQDLHIIHRTKAVPRAIELVNKSMDSKRKLRLKEILLAMHKDPKGKAVLKQYQKTSKFDELTPELLVQLETVRGMFRTVEAVLVK